MITRWKRSSLHVSAHLGHLNFHPREKSIHNVARQRATATWKATREIRLLASSSLCHFSLPVSSFARTADTNRGAACGWKLQLGIIRLRFSILKARQSRRNASARLDVNGCPRCDIYFIGVSLPSSMMIYNCCPLRCNYYNYRFFVRALGVGSGPSLFAPSLSMRLHPFGHSFLGPLSPLSLSLSLFSWCISLGLPLAFFPPVRLRSSLSPSPFLSVSLLLLLREQRPDLRRLCRRNGFWKLDSRARARATLRKPLSLLSPMCSSIAALAFRARC